MKIYLSEENVTIEWNDGGEPVTLNVNGFLIQTSEQDLRNLHACLDFLFSKPGGPA